MALNRSQYNSIMKIISDRRLEAEHALSDRVNEVISNYPEYSSLASQTASLATAAAKAGILGDDALKNELISQMDAVTNAKKELLIKYGYPEDYLTLHCTCEDCQDTGYIGQQKCHCFDELSSSVICDASSLSGFLEGASFDLLKFDYYEGEDLEHYRSSVSQCKEFVTRFDYDYSNLLFYGTVGTGKSYLTACIAKELINKGHSVIYFSSSELFRTLSDIMFMRGDKGSLEFLRDNIYNCDLLIIDDLGTELTNNATESQFFSLINERSLKQKSVIISTNLSLSELQERYTDRIFSRILSLFSIHGISGPDIRRIKRFENK